MWPLATSADLMAAIKRRLGVQLPPAVLFAEPTVAGRARALRERGVDDAM